MMYIQMIMMVLTSIVVAVVAIPLVWFILVFVPVIFLLMTPILALVGFIVGKLLNNSVLQKTSKILLIDNELDAAEILQQSTGRTWNIQHIGSSFRGVGKVLENDRYDFIAIRWTRHKLSGESILDYLDYAIKVHNERNGSQDSVRIPPVVFIRKPSAAEKFQIRRKHMTMVLGCVNLDRDTLSEQVQNCIGA